MLVTKLTRQSALVNHTDHYKVDDAYWQSLIDKGLTEEEALEEARSGKSGVTYIDSSTEMLDTVMVDETKILVKDPQAHELVNYIVTWEIDAFDCESPREAAIQAREDQGHGSTAVVFSVKNSETGETTLVDLLEQE